MRRKRMVCLLGIEAAVCAAFCLLSASFGEAFTTALAFPMEQIGLGLRALSLWNRVGNGLALMLYIAICLIPLWYWLRAKGKRGRRPEDFLLILLCLALFYVLYLMANPQTIPALFPVARMDAGLAAAKAILGGAVYALLLCYGLFRLLDVLKRSGGAALRRFLSPMLLVLPAFFVLSIFGGCFSGFLAARAAFRESNTGGHFFTEAFIGLRYLVEALPYGLAIRTAFLGADMLEALEGEDAAEKAEKLSRWCVFSLTATALMDTGFYLAQVLLSGNLRHIAGQINLPVLGLALTAAALLFARIVAENRRLKEENDMII